MIRASTRTSRRFQSLQLAAVVVRGATLSRFQRTTMVSGHSEGWALYAERLMDELGYLHDPAYRLGYLAAQMMRALRVVIDVGLHTGRRVDDRDPNHGGQVWTPQIAEAMRAAMAAAEVGGELEVLVETTADLVGCPECGAVARAKDRRPVWVRDLPVGGRPVVLCWHKRVWCCPHALCPKRTWTETHPAIAPRACLTERARQWAFEQVGSPACAVAWTARAFGVGWATVMRVVTARGTPVVDVPARLDEVTAVGVDETAYLRAGPTHPTLFATGVADLSPDRPARLLDVVAGRSGTVLAAWLAARDEQWKAAISTASLDPFRGYASALGRQLPDAVRVLDPFHVVRLGLSTVDEVDGEVHALLRAAYEQNP